MPWAFARFSQWLILPEVPQINSATVRHCRTGHVLFVRIILYLEIFQSHRPSKITLEFTLFE